MAAFPEIEDPLYTASGVEFEFLFENYQEQFTTRATNSVLKARCLWDDAADFLWDVLGWTEGTAGSSSFNRYLPLVHPEVTTLYCTNAVLASYPSSSKATANVGFTSEGGVATHLGLGEWCIYQLTFTRLPYFVLENEDVNAQTIQELFRYCVVADRPRAREFTINSYGLEVQATGTLLKTPAFIMDREQDIFVTLCEVPTNVYPKTAVENCLGKTNNASVSIPRAVLGPNSFYSQTFATDTLLFRGLANEITQYQGPNGQWYIDLPFYFTYRPNGWRKLPDPANAGAYVTVILHNISPTKYMYEQADFGTLFKPEP